MLKMMRNENDTKYLKICRHACPLSESKRAIITQRWPSIQHYRNNEIREEAIDVKSVIYA